MAALVRVAYNAGQAEDAARYLREAAARRVDDTTFFEQLLLQDVSFY